VKAWSESESESESQEGKSRGNLRAEKGNEILMRLFLL
jgi:hypothetical protein